MCPAEPPVGGTPLRNEDKSVRHRPGCQRLLLDDLAARARFDGGQGRSTRP
ncbi:hypothetical protein NKH18_38580 [Streptomyces sp. M10(2022)]